MESFHHSIIHLTARGNQDWILSLLLLVDSHSFHSMDSMDRWKLMASFPSFASWIKNFLDHELFHRVTNFSVGSRTIFESQLATGPRSIFKGVELGGTLEKYRIDSFVHSFILLLEISFVRGQPTTSVIPPFCHQSKERFSERHILPSRHNKTHIEMNRFSKQSRRERSP